MRKNMVRGMIVSMLALPALGACSSSGGDYCGAIKEASKDSSFTNTKDPKKALDQVKKVEDAAPADAKQDWANVREALEAMMNGNIKNVDMQKFQQSTQRLTVSVKEKCNVSLQGS